MVEVVTGLGVGNMPNNPRIDHGFVLEVGNKYSQGCGLEQSLDDESKKQLKKQNMDWNEPDEDVKADMFQFRKKGRLTKEEEVELKRTRKNMFDWVKVMPNVKPQDIMIEDDGQEDWMREEMMNEERLARLEMRRKEWERDYICKGIMDDILEMMAKSDTDKQELQERTIGSIMAEIKECTA